MPLIRLAADRPGRFPAVSRRDWLRLGGLAGLGLALPRSSRAGGTPGFGRAKSVVVVFANGGPGQHETFDPKPDAPLEVRGAFGAIRSAVPGTIVGEHLPRLAALADRYAIVRSMSHDDLDHGSAVYLALTGRYHPRKSSNPPPSANDHPTLGAALARVRPAADAPYTAVHVNGPALVPELPAPGQDAGLLGREFDPLLVGDVTLGPASRPDLQPPPDLPPIRVDARRSLLESLDTYRRRLEATPAAGMDAVYRRAYDLLDSPRSRAAFDLESEPDAIRERYGLHRSGQACLLARRLAEAEVPLITVFWNHSARGQDTRPDEVDAFGWDTHNDIFATYRDHLMPRFDLSVSALLEDLEGRGLLDQTLVLVMGEFGRAPRVAVESRFAGSKPGRKHWANAYSILAAGAGVSPGALIGATDRMGAYPLGDRFGPWDVSATILHALGVDPAATYTDALDRPFPLSVGRPIGSLYGES